MTVAFVQPFSVQSPGGGPRILRALIEDVQTKAISISMAPAPPPPTALVPEFHQPARPRFGILEPTRFHKYLGVAAVPLEPLVRRRLGRLLVRQGACVVHVVAHDATFWPVFRAALDLGLPVALSVHDHLDYNMRDRPERALALHRLGRVWRQADHRFVISTAMADEYCRRFGERSSEVITDGLTEVRAPVASIPGRCTVYFMGAFHMSYRANLEALVRGLERFQDNRPDLDVSLKMRCGELPGGLPPTRIPIDALPFGDEQAIVTDMEAADALWIPLPFGEEHAPFVRFSLSTKLVTYLGSGLPILYHGPADSAAGALLRESGAGVETNALEADGVARALSSVVDRRAELAERAGQLARRRFMLDELRERFWASLARLSPAEQAQCALDPARR